MNEAVSHLLYNNRCIPPAPSYWVFLQPAFDTGTIDDAALNDHHPPIGYQILIQSINPTRFSVQP